MAKFVLIYSGGSTPLTPEDFAREKKAWAGWYTNLGSAVLEPGNPFTPEAKHLSVDGRIGSGPVNSLATGFTILEADSLDHAAKMAQSCPVLATGGEISVYEAINTAEYTVN